MREFIAEIADRLKETRFWRRGFFWAGVAVVAGLGGSAAVYLLRAESRTLAAAERYMAQGDVRRAGLLLEQAVQVNPNSVRAQEALGDFLDQVDAPQAAGHWQAVVTLTGADRHRWKLAASLLRRGQVVEAENVLGNVSADGRGQLEHHRLLAGLALARGDRAAVEEQLAAIVALEPENIRSRFALAAHRLAEGIKVEASRAELERLARAGPLRARATLELIRDAPRRWPRAVDPDELLAARVLDGAGDVHLRAVAKRGRPRLVAHVLAPPFPEPGDAAAVISWLAGQQRATEALEWGEQLPESTRTHPAVAAASAEVAVIARDWARLEGALAAGGWGLVSPSLVREVFALRREQEETPRVVPARWQTLLESPDLSVNALRALSRLAILWGWSAEGERTLRQLVRRAPTERWGWEQLTAQLVRRGDSAAVRRVMDEWVEAIPDDFAAQRGRALIRLLTEASDAALRAEAGALFARRPQDPAVAVVQALAWRDEGKGAQGLRLLLSFGDRVVTAPCGALVLGVLLAENGRQEEAATALRLVREPLLPEERRLLQDAEERLRIPMR
jgi:thioredoxin-like negative regulator of GroEL